MYSVILFYGGYLDFALQGMWLIWHELTLLCC